MNADNSKKSSRIKRGKGLRVRLYPTPRQQRLILPMMHARHVIRNWVCDIFNRSAARAAGDEIGANGLAIDCTESAVGAAVRDLTGSYNPQGTRHILDEMLQVIEKASGRSLVPDSTFCRVYGHGALLQAHMDRADLDWTVSIMLRADAPWAIEVEDCGVWRTVRDAVGTGVLINGRTVNHRRSQPFAGTEAVVLLLHYAEREISS